MFSASPTTLDGVGVTYGKVSQTSTQEELRQYVGNGPETDAAWRKLGIHYKPILVPEDRAEEFGLKKGMAKRKLELGGGYVANFDGLHYLHCVVNTPSLPEERFCTQRGEYG